MPINIDKLSIPESLAEVCQVIKDSFGEVWLVGGCVRDLLLGIKPKDWDVEVYFLTEQDLETVLSTLGHFELVGKQFGVRKLWVNGLEIDVALPRQERKVGCGHRGFDVACDPNLPYEKAVMRRDFTINAMMYNPLSKKLLDFHGGQGDLESKLLRHVSPAFVEDPLRPLRAMQFAARFGFILHQDTCHLCKELLLEAKSLPVSRVWQEWSKWSRSKYPSFGLSVLRNMGWDSLYSELVALQDCPQDQYWHPEGDVWIHTCLVVDEAAGLAEERGLSERDRQVLLFSALCHDLGKPLTTRVDDKGNVVSPCHGEAGVEPSRSFLKKINTPQWLIKHVLPLVNDHGAHFERELIPSAVKCLAKRLVPSNIQMWELLAEADAGGRSLAPKGRPALKWLKLARHLHVSEKCEQPIITGQMLISWGMSQSPKIGEVLAAAYKSQMNGEIYDEASALVWFKQAYCKE